METLVNTMDQILVLMLIISLWVYIVLWYRSDREVSQYKRLYEEVCNDYKGQSERFGAAIDQLIYCQKALNLIKIANKHDAFNMFLSHYDVIEGNETKITLEQMYQQYVEFNEIFQFKSYYNYSAFCAKVRKAVTVHPVRITKFGLAYSSRKDYVLGYIYNKPNINLDAFKESNYE